MSDQEAPDGTVVYEVNRPRVLGETVEGETVLIDSRTGAYYGLDECGSYIWSVLRHGPVSAASVGEPLAALYGIDVATATEASAALLEQLAEHELVRASDLAASASSAIEPFGASPLLFRSPTLERFDDLEDLLLLDPIHDVDPERGWPIAKTDG